MKRLQFAILKLKCAISQHVTLYRGLLANRNNLSSFQGKYQPYQSYEHACLDFESAKGYTTYYASVMMDALDNQDELEDFLSLYNATSLDEITGVVLELKVPVENVRTQQNQHETDTNFDHAPPDEQSLHDLKTWMQTDNNRYEIVFATTNVQVIGATEVSLK